MSELIKIKDNKKSSVYENDVYKVRISKINKCFYKRNDADYVTTDDNLNSDDYRFVEAVKLEIKNKETGKLASKRCYQGFGAIEDVKNDIKNGKKKFQEIFNKIDL